ncbi:MULTISPECIES: Rieske (2Fe-2S) protein [Acidianus]|uniref:Ferredoxin n=1 Tax=Candidatus Acidianus copahuensis TaxID=1160895 RepID=A0A031LL21_9CREN|nr:MULTISPECIES: Rieske (2Fe-2S) protein [Acidianus]EZQ01598.1 ferredoxin [Candidatus Acidianus copahuensis]NON63521.1 Rieske (2Fe-2S) protein [Acidianus sp. RZ1]
MTSLRIRKNEIPEGSMVEYFFPDGKPWERKPVLLVNYKNQIYALEALCTHEGFSLEDGFITDDGKIVCIWHGSIFDIKSGKVVDGPARRNLKIYKVEQKDEEVMISE